MDQNETGVIFSLSFSDINCIYFSPYILNEHLQYMRAHCKEDPTTMSSYYTKPRNLDTI